MKSWTPKAEGWTLEQEGEGGEDGKAYEKKMLVHFADAAMAFAAAQALHGEIGC